MAGVSMASAATPYPPCPTVGLTALLNNHPLVSVLVHVFFLAFIVVVGAAFISSVFKPPFQQ